MVTHMESDLKRMICLVQSAKWVSTNAGKVSFAFGNYRPEAK